MLTVWIGPILLRSRLAAYKFTTSTEKRTHTPDIVDKSLPSLTQKIIFARTNRGQILSHRLA